MVVGLPRAIVPSSVMFLERHALRCMLKQTGLRRRCFVLLVAFHLASAIRRTWALKQHQQRPPADTGWRDQQRQGHEYPREALETWVEGTH